MAEVVQFESPPIVGDVAVARRTSPRLAPATIAAGVCVLALIAVAVLAPLLAPYQPNEGALSQRLLHPGEEGHLLGTDGQGRDILSRLVWGARPTLLAGITPVVVAAVGGITLGIVAGLGSPRLENAVMRTLDVFFAFPAVLLALAIAAALGPSLTSVIISLSVAFLPSVARVVQVEVARVNSADFMQAARASGARQWAIARRQVLPVVLPVALVYCTALVGLSIVFAAGLSFLGLGLTPPDPEWGSMLDDLRRNVYTDPTLALIPAVTIFAASIAFNVLGDGLRDLLDVRAR